MSQSQVWLLGITMSDWMGLDVMSSPYGQRHTGITGTNGQRRRLLWDWDDWDRSFSHAEMTIK